MRLVLAGLLDRLLCRLGRCRRCEILSTDKGIGGKCVACGRIHGWVAREELRAAMRLGAKS